MKKFTTLCFFILLVVVVKAQNFQGYSDATELGAGFSYNVKISVTPLKTSNVLHAGTYVIKLIAVNADSKGYYHKGKTNRYFTCAELGSICNPNKIYDVYVNLNYQCQNNGTEIIRFTKINEEKTVQLRLQPNANCSFDLKSVLVKSDNTIYQNRIREIEYPTTNGSGVNPTESTSTPSSSLTQPSASKSGLPPNTSGNDPLANYTPSTANGTATKTEVYVQAAATVAGTLIDQLNANYDKKIARLKAESDSRSLAHLKNLENFFKEKYLPAMDLAIKGDQEARMLLYYTSDEFHTKEMVPLREAWFQEALAKNNTDALMTYAASVIDSAGYHEKETAFKKILPYVELAKNKGSVDAAFILARWHEDQGDEHKALAMFRAAAEMGCPYAMYSLGLIYLYGTTSYLKYQDVINKEVGLAWLLKSVKPDYKESLYSRSLSGYYDSSYTLISSYFNPDAYRSLSNLYKNGKIVPKDKVKAKEYKMLFDTYGSGYDQKFCNEVPY